MKHICFAKVVMEALVLLLRGLHHFGKSFFFDICYCSLQKKKPASLLLKNKTKKKQIKTNNEGKCEQHVKYRNGYVTCNQYHGVIFYFSKLVFLNGLGLQNCK